MKDKLEGMDRILFTKIEQWAFEHGYVFDAEVIGYSFRHENCEPLAEADYQNGMTQDPRYGYGLTKEDTLKLLEDNIEEYENDYK